MQNGYQTNNVCDSKYECESTKETEFSERTSWLTWLNMRYQFGIESFNYLLDLWRGTHKKSALSVKEQLLIALLFYARGSFLHVIPLALTRVQHTRAVEFVTNAFCQGTRGSQEPVIAHLVFNLTSKVDRKWGCYT